MTDSTAVPVMNHGWTFKGWRAFLEDWIADGRLKRAILADFFDRLSAFGRPICGLCDRVHRAPREPIRPGELAEIRRTLQRLDETIDLYTLAAAAIDAAALAGRRAYGLLEPDDEGPAHPPFQHMHSYVAAECRRLELPADLIVRARQESRDPLRLDEARPARRQLPPRGQGRERPGRDDHGGTGPGPGRAGHHRFRGAQAPGCGRNVHGDDRRGTPGPRARSRSGALRPDRPRAGRSPPVPQTDRRDVAGRDLHAATAM